MSRYKKWCLSVGGGLIVAAAGLWAWQQGWFSPPPEAQSNVALSQTVQQVATAAETSAEETLRRALDLARESLQVLEQVKDYTATFVKRERVGGKLLDEEVMLLKVRHRPFSVYLKHLAPPRLKGQEAIWVQGANDDKLIAHGAGILSLFTVRLDPESPLAMQGNRYSIRHVGLKHLLQELLQLYEEHRDQLLQCRVRLLEEQVDGIDCLVLEVRAPRRWEDFPWAMARVYLDRNKRVPIRYEAYDWPTDGQKELPLLEHYYYKDLKLNVGLTDKDFDPKNEEYGFR